TCFYTVGDAGFLIEHTDNNRRGRVSFELSDVPAMTNRSLERRLRGWCGETNNVSTYACGLRRVSRITDNGRALPKRLTAVEEKAWLAANG
ncbi:hypothetical protein, partial [Listeria monocytogenes]|uniref:hypothetical protein n=1 Tax=Listeria monocytogenes TaxID=1639 RepID=UPI002FDBE270